MRSCDAEIGRINIKNTINQHFDSYLNTFLGHLEFYENYCLITRCEMTSLSKHVTCYDSFIVAHLL